MENLRETFEKGLEKKNVSARQMLIDLKINEPVYYDALKRNDIKLSVYREICKYLEIELNTNYVTNENISTNKMNGDYWKEKFEESQVKIGHLINTIQVLSLGKRKPVPFPPAYISMS